MFPVGRHMLVAQRGNTGDARNLSHSVARYSSAFRLRFLRAGHVRLAQKT